MSTDKNTYLKDDEGLEELLSLPVVVADEYRNWSPGEFGAMPLETPNSPFPTDAEPSMKSEEMRLLEAVVNDPGKPSSSYLKLAKLGSGSKASKARKRLTEQGYIRDTIQGSVVYDLLSVVIIQAACQQRVL